MFYGNVGVCMAVTSTNKELLTLIQTSARNGTLLPSCAPEVKELMVQIDSLISESQREWEKSLRTLQTQLQQRDRDVATLKVQLRERNVQVEHLRQESTALEREYKTRYTDYESQLEQLRGEVSRLNKAYSRLRAKRNTKVKNTSRPSTVAKQCDVRDEGRSPVGELVCENKELRESVGLLQETIQSKDQMISTLQEELSFIRSSTKATSCQTDLCQAQERLRSQLTLDKALREELGKLKDVTASLCSEPCRECEVAHQFESSVKELGPVALADQTDSVSEHLESALEHILEKHFDHLDSSIQQLFITQT